MGSKTVKKNGEYDKTKAQQVIDEVNTVFRNYPKDYIAKLEDIGFEYHEEEDYEALEEKVAEPLNNNQRALVLYFRGRKKTSKKLLEQYLEEKDAATVNYPLFRRYFKQANQHLKKLLIYGLDQYPGRFDLLSDLAFFHEFENVLSILITYYTRACMLQDDLNTFTNLVKDFYFCTDPDDYDALQALREVFPPGTAKREIIDFLIEEEKRQVEEVLQPVEIAGENQQRYTFH